jgi:hypothetical protein
MPVVANEDWIVRLRAKLGIVPKKPVMEKIPQLDRTKPLQPDLPLAKLSTPHPAGSLEKIEVMRLRVERGEQIFHPNDNRDVLC